MDISAAATPRSDQLNADDLLAGPQLVYITEVCRGSDEQPVEIHLREYPGRPFKPSKSMIRVLIAAWGRESSAYVGRRLMLYRDPEVTFGRDKVGGIRISAMSDIPHRLTLALTVTRGRRAPFTVEPLVDVAHPSPPSIPDGMVFEVEERIASAETVDALKVIGADLKSWNLGAHRDALQSAWSARKAEIEGGE